jgi:protein ImuA
MKRRSSSQLWAITTSSSALVTRLSSQGGSVGFSTVGAAAIWLAQARPQELRRLQLAAAQHHKLLFVMRHSEAAHTASPAVLRVQIAPCATHATGLRVEILKRRGPPLAQALHILPAQGQLTHVLAAAHVSVAVAVTEMASPDVFADAPTLDRAAA